MSTESTHGDPRALVTIFEDRESAVQAIDTLHEAGFSTHQMELVTHDLHKESPDVSTPQVHETTGSSIIDSAEKWGALGAGAGAAAGLLTAVLTPFPGIAIGMIVIGGGIGALVGGMAGVEHAIEDDAVNLPTIEEYDELLHSGHHLVVVHGTHDEVINVKDVISHLPFIHDHLHPIHGHEFHEHPAHGK